MKSFLEELREFLEGYNIYFTDSEEDDSNDEDYIIEDDSEYYDSDDEIN
jgi:hypothetical protein